MPITPCSEPMTGFATCTCRACFVVEGVFLVSLIFTITIITATWLVQEYAAATAEAEMAEAKSVRQGEEAEAFRRIADEKRMLAYQLADKWTGQSPSTFPPCRKYAEPLTSCSLGQG